MDHDFDVLVTSAGRHDFAHLSYIAERTHMHEHEVMCQRHNATWLQQDFRNLCRSRIAKHVIGKRLVHVTGHYQTNYMDQLSFDEVCAYVHVYVYVHTDLNKSATCIHKALRV
jgi:hypothetical protein